MNLITRRALACVLLLGASMVQAAGLGKLTVNSALGQILNAEIDLVSLQPGELDALNARVAPPEAFRDARIEYSSALRLLRFSVDKRANGSPYIKITSVAPINEPFVDMLIEVSWPAGRIQREYPILLDPPGYSSRGAPPTVAAAPGAPSRPAQTPPATAPAASSSAPASGAPATTSPTTDAGAPSARTELASTPPGAPRDSGSSAPTGSDTYGPIEKGDTLGRIAAQVKPQDVSLEQMLVALYRENQAAFINNNMNLLKTGQILKVPSSEEVQKIARADANTEYRTHVADWNNYRGQVATGVASLPARAEPSTAAAGKVASAAVTPPAPPAAESKDVLKLSKSDAAAAGKAGAAKGGGGNQDRLNALQEELTAKDKALRESQSRVSDLEKQIRDMQRLLDLKAGAPAKADPKVAAAPTPAPKAEPPKVEAPKAEPPKVAAATPPATAKVEPAKPAEPPKTEPAKTEPPKAAEAKPAPPKTEPPKTDAKAPAKKAPPPPPPEKGFVDELMDNPAYLAGGLGILAALGIGGFMLARRRKAGAEAGPSSSMTSAFPSDLKPGAATGKPAGGLVDTGNSSFLTDFDKTGPGTIDTDEVDPVAEAEVYIAYGRDAQAEEILKEAMARDKGRHEIPLKLLEIYHARKSATAFETVAKELRSSVGEESPLWQKAAAMGAQIDPTNPLYAAGAGAAAQYQPSSTPAAKPDVDFGIDQPTNSQPAPDFDLDVDPTKSRSPESTGQQSTLASGMDFDIHAGAPTADSTPEAPKETPASFDFDLSGLDMGGSKPAASLETTNSPSPMADLSLDLDSGSGGGGGGEGVATKLELAKAYLEIGDKDGAREILQEVAKEGSASQREEAEKLIASL